MREEGPGRHSRVQVDRGRAERQIDKFNLLIYFVPFPPILLVEGDQGVPDPRSPWVPPPPKAMGGKGV